MSHAKHLAVSRAVAAVTAVIVLALTGVAIAKSHGTTIRLGKTSYGTSLVALRLQDGRRLPIYISTHDGRDKSRCFGGCAEMFTPVLAQGKIRALRGVRRTLLGVTDRGHGVMQVTYNHHPLYTGTYDTTPGVASEDGCQLYGGSWYVVGRNGHPDTRFSISCTGGY